MTRAVQGTCSAPLLSEFLLDKAAVLGRYSKYYMAYFLSGINMKSTGPMVYLYLIDKPLSLSEENGTKYRFYKQLRANAL